MRLIIVAVMLLAPTLALADAFDGNAVNGYNSAATPNWGDNVPTTDYSQPVPQTTYGDDN
jgi:hypothetical protein